MTGAVAGFKISRHIMYRRDVAGIDKVEDQSILGFLVEVCDGSNLSRFLPRLVRTFSSILSR